MVRVACFSFDSKLFGSERSLLDGLRGLDPAKISPRLIVTERGPLQAVALAQGLPVDVFPWVPGPSLLRGPRSASAAVRLAALLRRLRIDVLELNRLSFSTLMMVNAAARLAGCRTVARVRMPGAPISLIQKLALACTDRVLSVSESSVAPWKRGWWPEALQRRLRVIPDSRDVTRLGSLPRERSLLRALGVPDGAPVVGMVGAITANKRQDLFLETAAAVLRGAPDAWFVIVGGALDAEGEVFEASLRRGLAGKPLASRVVFTGYREDAPALMRNLDLLVVPSDREAFAGVIIEGMALGVPVVAHAVDGVPEMIEHGVTGLLVDAQGPAAYAAAAARVLADPAFASRLTAAARLGAERFDRPRVARQLEALYTELA